MKIRSIAVALGTFLVSAVGIGHIETAQAVQASFTIEGTVTAPSPTLGYSTGAAVSFTWVLDHSAVAQARYSGPAVCCGTVAWYQDLFSSTPQLWKSITGTGLTGAWSPPANADDGNIFLSAGTFPQPYTASFGMLANAQLGSTTGLQVNGRSVSALQMNAVYLGLDAVGQIGQGGVFSDPPPDPTALFVALAGTYAVDRTFSDFCSIWASGPGGGQFIFRIDSLTIAAVPEPGVWVMFLAGGLGVLGMSRRRSSLRSVRNRQSWEAASPR